MNNKKQRNATKLQKEKAIITKGTNEIMTSKTLEEAVKDVIRTGDEVSLMTWGYNAVQTSSFQYTLAVEEVLRQMFREDRGIPEKMTPSQEKEFEKQFQLYIDRFHTNIRDFLLALGQVHSYGTDPMTPKDMEVVGEIAKAKYPHEKRLVLIKKLGIALPDPQNPLDKKYLASESAADTTIRGK